jgi:hypothetical protein
MNAAEPSDSGIERRQSQAMTDGDTGNTSMLTQPSTGLNPHAMLTLTRRSWIMVRLESRWFLATRSSSLICARHSSEKIGLELRVPALIVPSDQGTISCSPPLTHEHDSKVYPLGLICLSQPLDNSKERKKVAAWQKC